MNLAHRSGDWMQTASGRSFWPLDPRPEEVYAEDIAHALGRLCRYNGHSREFYSVAEHCVLMSEAVAPEFALAALLHDATEAYVADVPRPLKPYLIGYADIEEGVWHAIADRFGVDRKLPAEVKDADTRILIAERDVLMEAPPLDWGIDVEPLPVRFRLYPPKAAASAWLQRFDVLTEGRFRP